MALAPPAEELIGKNAPPAQEPQSDPSQPFVSGPAAPSDSAQPSGNGAAAGAQEEPAAEESVPTPWGPLSAADRDLLAKVRLAGLWEIPTGRQAAKRALRAATRKNLGEIARQHTLLDAEVRQVAGRLRVPLPDEATEEQQGWMAEISGKKGLAYDMTAVMRLRLAHGKIFPAIGAVRGSTRNTLIRDFAESAAMFVNTHMSLLEGTGLVGDTALPPVPTVSGAPSPVPSGDPAPSAPPATSLLARDDD
ncbi:DUF4142 domain-containing protein [Sphaerisporangium melleum]|uniref:DUF4142 domain-containing protein n=1 Tax=Sphaerisporangium melleum TaxID=321316 RepID=UPI001E43EDCB|nr:DUF4142 domain-containing protein [Sphaerisporangium melleum]